MRRFAALSALLAALGSAIPATAQSPYYDRGRAYDRCASEAARSAGPAPRQHPRPGDDLVTLERAKQRHEDAYYQALDRCLSRVTDPRQPRRY